MPKLEPKEVQRDLEQGWLWPVYWLYGPEQMKTRELMKRIRRAVLGEEESAAQSAFQMEVLDGSEVQGPQVLDALQSLSLGGGVRLIIVRDAHLVKGMESIEEALGPKSKKEDLSSVCICLSKDLDGRKKFSKTLIKKAAVVFAEEIAESDREAWIGYLAKRRGLELEAEQVARLRALDPWNLDILDNELEKIELLLQSGLSAEEARAAILETTAGSPETDEFLEMFFRRKKQPALERIGRIAESLDAALPLLGLLSWNARYLGLKGAEKMSGKKLVSLSPFLQERFVRWSRTWSLEDVIQLQAGLAELDFELKQTGRLPLGSWTQLVLTFCRDERPLQEELSG